MRKLFPLLLAFTLAFAALPLSLPAATPPAAAAGAATPAGATVYDLNRVTFDELLTIKGIGPALAGRIIDYRASQGPFSSVEELLQVKGIGQKSLARLKPSFTLSPPPSPVANSTSPNLP